MFYQGLIGVWLVSTVCYIYRKLAGLEIQTDIIKFKKQNIQFKYKENQWQTGSKHTIGHERDDTVQLILIMLQTKYQLHSTYTSWEI